MNKCIAIVTKKIFPLFIIWVCLFVFFFVVENKSGIKNIKIHRVSFELPIPALIAGEVDISMSPDIDSVFVSGLFCDWDSHDENYRLQPDPEVPGRWNGGFIPVAGENQYKFIVYIKGENPLWIYDLKSKLYADDGVGGFNSIYYHRDTGLMINIINAVFAGIILLYCLLSVIYDPPKRSFVVIVAFVTIALFSYDASLYKKNHLLNGYSRYLYGKFKNAGVDFDVVNSIENRNKISRVLNNFLWNDLDKIGSESLFKNSGFVAISYCSSKDVEGVVSRGVKGAFEKGKIEELGNYEFRKYLKSIFYRKMGNSFALRFKPDTLSGKPVIIGGGRFPFLFLPYIFYFPIVGIDGGGGIFFYIRGNSYVVYLIFLLLISGCLLLLKIFGNKAMAKSDEAQSVQSIDHSSFEYPDTEKKVIDTESRYMEYRITGREKDIIAMIARGLPNKQISGELNITQKTVDNHIYNIFQKTGVKNRIELVNLFFK